MRRAVLEFLLQRTNGDHQLNPHAIKKAVDAFKTSMRTVSRLWTRAKPGVMAGTAADIGSRKKGNCVRKKRLVDVADIGNIQSLDRTSLRSLSAAIGMPVSTLHLRLKQGDIHRSQRRSKNHDSISRKAGLIRDEEENTCPEHVFSHCFHKYMQTKTNTEATRSVILN